MQTVTSPAPSSRWVVLKPPFVVLVVGFFVALMIGGSLAAALEGSTIDLSTLGFAIAGGGYALFASLFLWVDARFVSRLPTRTWVTEEAMWRGLVTPTIVAIIGALLIGLVITGALSLLAREGSGSGADVFLLVALVVSTGAGAIRNVQVRRRMSFAAPASPPVEVP
jgi:hypothetical protein